MPLSSILVTVPVIIADNVAEFFFAASPIEDWDVRRDFHDLTPRLPHCFVEMGRPSLIRLGMTVSKGTLAAVRIGGRAVRVAEGVLSV